MPRMLGKSLILFFLLVLLSGTIFLSPKPGVDSVVGAEAGRFGQDLLRPPELLQYAAGGHVLGFRDDGVIIASVDHALRVEFVNGRPISPAAEATSSGPAEDQGRAPALRKVTYRDIWDGASAIYEKTASGVVKSSFIIQARGAKASDPVGEIRLRYNVPVRIDENGDLLLSLATGEMRETHPVAWQDISGRRELVKCEFRLLDEREVGFEVGACDPRYPLVIDPTLSWHTFLGGTDYDWGHGIAVDASGNTYVTGYSNLTWGTPIRPFTEGDYWMDAFVTKLGANGILQWNTFLGGTGEDGAKGISVDMNGQVYVIGVSSVTWGAPVRPFSEGSYETDAFVAKLDNNGNLLWNTFLGGLYGDGGAGITVDGTGNVYVDGYSRGTWGQPIRPFSTPGYYVMDAFVAKLGPNGDLQWNTFLGGTADDNVYDISVDTSGNAYVSGGSAANWGSPVNPYAGNYDAFAAMLGIDGDLQWSTFLGGPEWDEGYGIAVGQSGTVYVIGGCHTSWGSPDNPFAGAYDAFVAKLGSDGDLQWNTFLGGSDEDYGIDIAVDTSGTCCVIGESWATWGSPHRSFTGIVDAFVAKLDSQGALYWNTFLGGSDEDYGAGIAMDTSGNPYVIGNSYGTWGTPVNPVAGFPDVFVAKIGSGIRVDFNRDGQEDILWRYYGSGGYNRAWFLGNSEQASLLLNIGNSQMASFGARAPLAGKRAASNAATSPRAMGMSLDRIRKTAPRTPRNLMGDINGRLSGLATVRDPRLAGGSNPKSAPAGISDPRLVGPALLRETSSDALTELASAPSYLGGADVMPVGDLNWQIVGTGDFNNDTHVDILWRYNGPGGYNIVWFMNGAEWSSSAELLPVGDLSWKIVGIGDFNKDGNVDILWRNAADGSNVVWYMDGTEWIGSAFLLGVSDPNWQIVGTGHFNSDEYIDILWRYNGVGGHNVVWYMNAQSEWIGSAELISVPDLTWQIMGTGDYNNDGNIDILWRYNSAGGYNCIWYMKGVIWDASADLLPVADLTWRIVSR